ncbi:RNA polymerase subunit sigma-24 [Pedobacter sp. HMWF019]|nr:RNA polymerase subunit sigma-24 [Pedobacter sp. HMWF019]
MKMYATLSDAELLASLKQDSKAAFDEIYKRYWQKSFNEAYKRLREAQVCEELIQDVFADLWLKRVEKNIDNLEAYINVSVRYQVFMQYKKGKRLPVFEEPLEHMAIADTQADSEINLKELKAKIEQWLELQPEKRKEIFKMRFQEELSTKEISDILGIAQKTVQNQLLTATNHLKDTLDKAMTISMILMAMKS